MTRTAAPAPTTAEAEVREFARLYPTPNVLEALAHCESGRLPWDKVRDLFARSLGAALNA